VEGETGLLVPPGDPEALAEAIGRVLALTAEQREQLAEQAKDFVRRNFSREQMCAGTLGVYGELLPAKGTAG
jgi:glycosyltransferase involved in cell wall biosynthesis